MDMNMLDITKLNSPLDIPRGTILVQHWLNSSTFYMVRSTTKKSVVVVKMPSKQVRFEHEGGGTGRSYKMPDEQRLAQLQAEYEHCCKKYGFDVLSNKATQADFDKAHKICAKDGTHFWDDFGNVSNERDCLIPKRIMVKPAKNGGFYIPGVIRGSYCGNMELWNGSEEHDYYGD